MARRLSRIGWLGCLLAAFSLLAASCGDDDGEDAVDEQPSTSASGDGTATTAAGDTGCAAVDLSTPPAEPVTMRFGHGVAAEETFWLMDAMPEITEHQGSWYEMELQPFPGSEQRLVAFQAGQLDAALVPPQSVIRGIAQGLDLVPIATIMREGDGPDVFNTTFLTLSDSGIEGPEDLEGKTIAILDIGSHLDYMAKAGVAEGGFDPQTGAQYVVLPFPAQEQALRGGQVDVVGLPEPFYTIAHNNGDVVDLFDAVDVSGFPFDLLTMAFDRGFVEENPEAVCAWLTDYQASVDFYLSDIEGARTAIHEAGFVQPPLPLYLQTGDYERPLGGVVDVDAYLQLNQAMIEFGVLQPDQEVSAEDLVLEGFTAGTKGAPEASGGGDDDAATTTTGG